MLMTSNQLSTELMQGLAEIAVKEHRAGRCKSFLSFITI